MQVANVQSTSTLQHERSRLGWIGWLAPLGLSVVALTLYLHSLSNVHTFDALSYIRDVDGRTGFFFHPHHLLYSPTGWLFWQGWRAVGYRGGSELALKVLNALAGAGCGFGLCALASHITGRLVPALVAGGALMFNYATWYFSAEVEVYLLALIWLLLTLALLSELVTAPRARTAPLLGLVVGAAALYHQTNALLVPIVMVAALVAPLTWRGKLRALVICGLLSALVVAAGYGIVGFGVNGARSFRQLRDWMFFFVETGWWGHATRGRWIDLGAGLGNTISTQGALPYWIGIIVVLVVGWQAVRRWPRIVLACVSWVAIYAAFFIWWEADNIEFWIGTLLPLWLLLALALAAMRTLWLSRAASAVALVGTFSLAWHNYPIVKLRGDATFDLQRQLSVGVREQTSPEDLILAPGGVMELYLPYYEGRPNVHTLNGILFETNGNLDQALGRIAGDIRATLHAGLRVIVGREMMELAPEVFQRYDIPQARLDAFWKPYRAAMVPAVVNKGETYFWRFPSATDLIAGDGWRWTSFDWGWDAANITAPTFDSGGWCFDAQSDPMISSAVVRFDAAAIHALTITMATRAQHETAQFFYAGADGNLSDEHSVHWKLKGDGQPHTYTIPLEGQPGWNGTITKLRLDPIAVGDGTPATHTCVQSLGFVR